MSLNILFRSCMLVWLIHNYLITLDTKLALRQYALQLLSMHALIKDCLGNLQLFVLMSVSCERSAPPILFSGPPFTCYYGHATNLPSPRLMGNTEINFFFASSGSLTIIFVFTSVQNVYTRSVLLLISFNCVFLGK